jgi:hypothetical protein
MSSPVAVTKNDLRLQNPTGRCARLQKTIVSQKRQTIAHKEGMTIVMRKTMWLAVVVVGMITIAGVSGARAQIIEWEDRAFVNVSVGAQTQSHQFESSLTFPLYDETGVVNASYDNGGGFLFDIGGGVRIRRNIGAGVSFSRFSNTSDVPVDATIPHPIFFDQPRQVTTAAAGLKHSEVGINIFGLWMIPLSEKTDLAVFGGPSIFMVKQDLVSGVSIPQPEAPPFTPVVTPQVSEGKGNAIGFNVGVDWTYMVTPQFGAGAFARFNGGPTADVSTGDQAVDVRVGGFQIGGGIRIRFKGDPLLP